MWRADGKEIFYVASDGMMMAVPVESGEGLFRPGAPKPLFQTRFVQLIDTAFGEDVTSRQYDVTAGRPALPAEPARRRRDGRPDHSGSELAEAAGEALGSHQLAWRWALLAVYPRAS